MFRSKSGKAVPNEYESHSTKDYKMHTANVHDPILSAVNEAQPFEEAADRTVGRRPSYLSQESNNFNDIFGNSIGQSDMSNPTRGRNERPLDTIRGFEYAITGDPSYKDQLESQKLGWGFHEDFPYQNMTSSQQNNYVPEQGQGQSQYARPNINFDSQPMYSAQNYSASSLKNDAPKKKKKGGLFSRKK